jgi:hypothetical protein
MSINAIVPGIRPTIIIGLPATSGISSDAAG